MTGLLIKGTLEPWTSSLRDVKARMRTLFRQEPVAASAGCFLDGLWGGWNAERRVGCVWEAARDHGSWRQQLILSQREAGRNALRNILSDYVIGDTG